MKRLFRFVHETVGMKGEGTFLYICDGRGRELRFNARNTQFRAIYMPENSGGYEMETSALLDLLIGPDDTFFDIGANWGYYALFIASRSDFRGVIQAFEPVPSTFADLENLVTQAELGDQVICHQMALSDAPGLGHMILEDPLQSGLARLRPGGEGFSVPIQRLDDLGLLPANVMKIDVEGHEAEMLQGAIGMIARAKPMILFESWREAHEPERTLSPFKVLEDQGYLFFHPGWLREAGGTAYGVEMPSSTADTDGDTLALIRITPEQRFFMGDQINIFACHRDRIHELSAVFEKRA